MQQTEYYEDDLIRITDLVDSKAHIFTFYPRDTIIRIYDQDDEGEQPDDFDVYTDAFDEIAYLVEHDQEPLWPIVVEHE